MRRISGVFVALLVSTVPTAASAQLALMPKIGTPGVGADLAYAASDWVVVRAGGAFSPYDPEFTVSELDWKVQLPSNGLVAVDLHLGGSGFRVSGGAFFLADDVIFDGVLSESVEIGGTTYQPDEVGELNGTVEFESLSPFLSLGFGRAGGSGAGLFIELGAALVGDPTVGLEHSGGNLTGPERLLLDENVRELEDDVQEELKDVNVYPILNIGVRIGL